MKKQKNNKFIYGFKLYVNYGRGYEYEIFETTHADARARVREYRENCPQYPIKLSRGREINDQYIAKGKQ